MQGQFFNDSKCRFNVSQRSDRFVKNSTPTLKNVNIKILVFKLHENKYFCSIIHN